MELDGAATNLAANTGDDDSTPPLVCNGSSRVYDLWLTVSGFGARDDGNDDADNGLDDKESWDVSFEKVVGDDEDPDDELEICDEDGDEMGMPCVNVTRICTAANRPKAIREEAMFEILVARLWLFKPIAIWKSSQCIEFLIS